MTEIRLSCEEFNELLLLFNQRRVTREFFSFFFLQREPDTHAPLAVPFANLADGIRRFRGFAMLRFGNFRFAYRNLSKKSDWKDLIDTLKRGQRTQKRRS